MTLAGLAVLAFAAGEVYLLFHADSGRLRLARYAKVGDPARVTLVVGRQAHRGLAAVGVPADSIHDLEPGPPSIAAAGALDSAGDSVRVAPAVVRWRVGLTRAQSLLQTNYAITHCVEEAGGEVLSGRESVGRRGEILVTLVLGLPGRPTHEIVLAHAAGTQERGNARLALVLYGFGDDPARAESAFRLGAPFAVALSPATPASGTVFRAAQREGREVVLQLPLEPINYPQVSPGPGTVLVTMKPAEITGLTRRYLDQAGPVAAVANHMGSLATQDMAVMTAVYRELKRRRLPFIHIEPVPGAVCRPLAAQLGVVYELPDAVLDAEARAADARALDRRWDALLAGARTRGRAVVWMRDTAVSRAWLARALEPRRLAGVDLVPLSSLLPRPADL